MSMQRGDDAMGTGKRVLYAASTFGHLRSFHQPYLQALVDRGDEVVALAAGDRGGIPEGVRCVSAPFAKSFTAPENFRAALQVAHLVRDERIDLVLTHTSLAAFFVRLGVMMSGRRDMRVVNTVHGYLFDDRTPAPRRAMMLGAEKLTAGVTDLVVVMNDEDERIARDHSLGREPVVKVSGMGVDLTTCRVPNEQERMAARRACGLADDAFALLYAAEFSGRKSQDVLVRALTRLPQHVVLVLAGRGERLDDCRALARELGVEERVLFPGFVDDLRTWRWAADACVSASRYEGLPFHVVEAMACGLPLVLSDVKGHKDLVGSGADACGLLYPYGDEAACADGAARLIGDGVLRRNLGRRAREASAGYGLNRVFDQVIAWYR